MSDDSLIYEILVDMLGEPDKVSRNNQYGFSCPLCSQEKGLDRDFKGNLEVNTRKGVYHCWSCGEIAGTKGRIRKLVRKFGARRHLSQYDLLVTEDYEIENEFDRPVTLPTEYESFEALAKRQGLLDLAERPFLFILTCYFAGFFGKNTITYKKLRKGVWETEN